MTKSKAGIKADRPALRGDPLAVVQIIAIKKEPVIGQACLCNHVARQEKPDKCGKLNRHAIATAIGCIAQVIPALAKPKGHHKPLPRAQRIIKGTVDIGDVALRRIDRRRIGTGFVPWAGKKLAKCTGVRPSVIVQKDHPVRIKPILRRLNSQGKTRRPAEVFIP
jgi:hypothetical protein